MSDSVKKSLKSFVTEAKFLENTITTNTDKWRKISIVTPSFNQGQYIERTILSILNQGYPNLEYIVIDGGSKDHTLKILQKYDKHIDIWVSEKDFGQADAIQKGFNKCTGDIFAWLNSDDIYLPNTLFEVAKAFMNNSNVDLVFGNIVFINENEDRVGELRFTSFDRKHQVFIGGNIHQTASFWTRDIYHRVGGINKEFTFCMDVDFLYRVGEIGNIHFIKKYLSGFRVHAASKSTMISDVGALELDSIRMELKQLHRFNNRYANFIYKKSNVILCEFRRVFNYIIQGDLDYVIKGLWRRCTRRS